MDRVFLFLGFFAVVFILFGLFQWRLYRAYRRWVFTAVEPEARKSWFTASTLVLVVFNGTLLVRFLTGELGAYDHPLVQALIVYPSGMFFAAVVLGFLMITLADAGRLLGRLVRISAFSPRMPVSSGQAVDRGRRRFLRLSGTSVIAAVGATPVFSAVTTARDYQINHIPLVYPDLPKALEGFTIAQISDIHSGVFMTEDDMREIFELTNGLHPNLTVITGDLVDNADSQIPSLHRALPLLKADYGVFACLGNHDHYATATKVSAAVEDRSVTVLTNSNRRIAVDDAAVSLIGIDDAGRGARNFANIDQALADVDPESLKVLLSHRPDVFPEAKRRGIDLMLSGHTHGGQVGVEWMGLKLNPVYLLHTYARGLYHEEGKYNYVNVGVGMVGVPIRLVRPEIALLRLTRGSSPTA